MCTSKPAIRALHSCSESRMAMLSLQTVNIPVIQLIRSTTKATGRTPGSSWVELSDLTKKRPCESNIITDTKLYIPLHPSPRRTTSNPRIRTQRSRLPSTPLNSLLPTTQSISNLLRQLDITLSRLIRLPQLLKPLLRRRLVTRI